MARIMWKITVLAWVLGLCGCNVGFGGSPQLVGGDSDAGLQSDAGWLGDAAEPAKDAQAGDSGPGHDTAQAADTEPVDAASPSCTANNQCGKSQFCAKPPGQCGGSGTCLALPTSCPDITSPANTIVCGCNGVTYADSCYAAKAGVPVAQAGQCGAKTCGIMMSSIPCTAKEFCATPQGQCAAVGTCVAKPAGCDKIYAPVCGCDGQTYGNECAAAMAGVGVAKSGACEPVATACQVYGDMWCGPNKYCAPPEGTCSTSGTCQPQPQACPMYEAPVCGCDGQTYGNPCFAAAAGVGYAKKGACDAKPQVCGPGADGTTANCAAKSMTCDIHGCSLDTPGKCVAWPAACPEIYSPVCGCNGKTYGNDCERLQGGVAFDHDGACGPSPGPLPCGGFAGIPCVLGMICDIQSCGADQMGVCVPAPKGPCPKTAESAQECGCDGSTYANACERQLAGAAFDSSGPCGSVGGCSSASGCKPGQGCVNGMCKSCPPDLCAAVGPCQEGYAHDPCTCACYLP